MPKSTARFLAYDLRPAKQAERRILLDYLESAKEGGMTISDCRYVGMGGFKFYDFVLMHRYAGIKNMVSLEHDAGLIQRCEFNKPYNFIKVKHSSVRDFIATDKYEGRSIFWLDYDDSLSDAIMDDIQALGSKVATNSFVFITIAADVPRDLAEKSEPERLSSLSEQFGDFANSLTTERVEDAAFPIAMHEILSRAVINAFAARTDGKFFPSFQILYRDTTNMLTIGGHFCAEERGPAIAKALKRTVPFLARDPQPFKIRNFNISDRERHLFEFAATKRKGSREANKLIKLGLKLGDVTAYRDLVRFLPRYVETII